MSIIEVSNLTKDYKTATGKHRALDNISFSVEKGDSVGLIGMNGAGKSTAIKILTGIIKPTMGSVLVNGKVPYLNKKVLSHHYGVMFGQRSQLWWDLPAIDSFIINGSIYGLSKKEVISKISLFSEISDLSYINTPVRHLSLGQRMVCDLFLVLVHEPELLFLDEATIAMDIFNRKNILDLISKINYEFGQTMIFTSHSLTDIESVCKKIILLDKGKVIYDGSLDIFLNENDQSCQIQIKYSDLNSVVSDSKTFKNQYRLETSVQGYYLTLYCQNNKNVLKEIISKIYSNPYVSEINVSSISLENRLLSMEGRFR